MDSRMKRRSIKLAESAITCKKEVEFIADYLSSDLDLQQSKAFENHLKICGDCVAFLETYKKTIELTRVFLSSPGAIESAGRLDFASSFRSRDRPLLNGNRIFSFPSPI